MLMFAHKIHTWMHVWTWYVSSTIILSQKEQASCSCKEILNVMREINLWRAPTFVGFDRYESDDFMHCWLSDWQDGMNMLIHLFMTWYTLEREMQKKRIKIYNIRLSGLRGFAIQLTHKLQIIFSAYIAT